MGKAEEPYICKMTSAQHRALLHNPQIVAHLVQVAQRGADMANSMAGIENAEYGVLLQNNGGTERARAYIKPTTAEGTIDDHYHSTLYKVVGQMAGM